MLIYEDYDEGISRTTCVYSCFKRKLVQPDLKLIRTERWSFAFWYNNQIDSTSEYFFGRLDNKNKFHLDLKIGMLLYLFTVPKEILIPLGAAKGSFCVVKTVPIA